MDKKFLFSVEWCKPFGTPRLHFQMFLLLTSIWAVCWIVFPVIALSGDFIDVLENIVWGSHFQFGYDKNPYFGAWFGYFIYKITGESFIVNYVASQLFVLTAFWCVWKLALRITSDSCVALASVLLMFCINYYGMKSVELCDDVMELGLWPLTWFFFYRALKDGNRFRDWLAVGFFAGLSFMTKYRLLR